MRVGPTVIVDYDLMKIDSDATRDLVAHVHAAEADAA